MRDFGSFSVWILLARRKPRSANARAEQPLSIRLFTCTGFWCAGNSLAWISSDLLFMDVRTRGSLPQIALRIHIGNKLVGVLEDLRARRCPELRRFPGFYPYLGLV